MTREYKNCTSGRAEREKKLANVIQVGKNSDRGCVLDPGKNHFEGSADSILDDLRIQELYPGSRREGKEVG